ncbi:MAG: phosphatase PAP2 family protein [bacterium]|nr:phosphatase PAP2 family protein [bacterium]
MNLIKSLIKKVCFRWFIAIFAVLYMAIVCPYAAYASEEEAFPYELNTTQEIILGGLVLTTMGSAVIIELGYDAPSQAEIESLNKNDINSFDRSATGNWSTGAKTASDVLLYSMGAIPYLLYSPLMFTDNKSQWFTIAVMYTEAMSLGYGINLLVKNSVGRKRPYLYNTSIPISERMELAESSNSHASFYSGHLSSAFISAVFIAKVYGDLNPKSISRFFVWGVSLGAAGTMGYLRYAAGKHFFSDILVGAAMGSMVGYLIPWLHEKNDLDVAIIPFSGERSGICVAVQF